jgi:group I intron endonuclease
MPVHLGLPTLFLTEQEGKMEEVKNIIYKAKNEERKCFYVGKSVYGLTARKHQHKHRCFKTNSNYKLYNFIRKYGWDTFTWEILAVYSTPEELPQAEIDWLVEQKKEFSDWKCLNLTDGGDGNLGWKPSEEIKRKISVSNKGEKNHNFGKTMTKTQKEKIGKKLKGRILSKKTREKMSNSKKGKNNPMFGIHRFGENAPNFGRLRTDVSTLERIKNAC